MPLPSKIKDDLRDLLRVFKAAHGTVAVPTGAGKALEAWLLIKMAHTAKADSWRVTLCRGDGSTLPAGTPFKLPDQRSRIPPSRLSAPGYVLLEHSKESALRFELRGNLQWIGRSDARHECDISMLPAVIGEAIRKNGGGYPHGLPIVAVECKDKTSDGSLDETRQALARLYDLALITRPSSGLSCRIYEMNTGKHWGHRSSTYVSLFARGTFGIARAGNFQKGAGTLAEHYHIGCFDAVYDPAGKSVARLLDSFKKTLRAIATF